MPTHLSIHNQSGSVEHYYHFLLGFLIPLIASRKPLGLGHNTILIRSCALQDRHLRALAIPGLHILDRDTHASLSLPGADISAFAPLQYQNLEGFDAPGRYSTDALWEFAAWIKRRYAAPISIARRAMGSHGPAGSTEILLIGRRPAHAYYHTPQSELPGGGSERRSIPNLVAIAQNLRARGARVRQVYLEGQSLWQQVALFDRASVIVAQHGAALANLVFARPNACVLEVMPQDQPHKLEIGHFSQLAPHMQLRHGFVSQRTSHSPLDPDSVLQALGEIGVPV